MTQLTIPSFAKINWILEILGKRTDGYHELRTIYQTIDLGEEIVFESTSGQAIQLQVEGREVTEGEHNLVYQAAQLLRKTAGVRSGVKMHLRKKIPVGAGLGGGSSNAAVTLLALNHLWDSRLPLSVLSDLAAQLGSDVPFFLVGGTAQGLGRGENIVPLPDIGAVGFVLFYPGFAITTKEAYALQEREQYAGGTPLTKEDPDTTIQPLRRAIENEGRDWDLLANDFESSLFRNFPALETARGRLQSAGCERVLLCGSGSALLGLGNLVDLKTTLKQSSRDWKGEIFFCQTLSRKMYRNILRDSGVSLL